MENIQKKSLYTEAHRIFIHARWPVQSYVVLAFMFGIVLTKNSINLPYIVAGIAWVLIVVGLTVLNSYYDKDEAPVGGMQNPPKVNESLLYGAIGLIIIGLLIGIFFGLTFWLLELAVVVIYFFYSYEGTRWKTNGYMAVGINAIVGSLTLLGAASLGGNLLALEVILAGICGAAFKASVYSMMQVHQIEDDTARGDISFAVMHGRLNTLRFSQITFVIAGVFGVAATYVMNLHLLLPVLTGLFFGIGIVLFEIWIRQDGDAHQDALRMQRMIAYTGYAGSIAFFIIYISISVMGLI